MSETKAKRDHRAAAAEDKKPRGPKKSAADKLAELIDAKSREAAKLGVREDIARAAHELAKDTMLAAQAELKQLEAAHKALVGGAPTAQPGSPTNPTRESADHCYRRSGVARLLLSEARPLEDELRGQVFAKMRAERLANQERRDG